MADRMPDNGVVSDQAELQAPMWSTNDSACDQCRSKKQRCERQQPICSNCKRLGLTCDYSGRGKRPNQNTELIRRLRKAETRIGSLETSIFRIQPYLDRFEAESVLLSLPTAGELSSDSNESTQGGNLEWRPISPEVQQEPSEERGSITSLALECTKIAVAKYGGNNRTSGPLATLNSSLRHISEIQEQSQDRIDMRVTVLRPPLAILQGMATTYFDMLNDSFPIFSRDRFEEHMKHYDESANGSEENAYSLCFNNIILLTLMVKARHRLAQDMPAAMELELLKTFSENAFGAFGSLESLLHPRIANVQALLSLSLVCQSMCLTDLARRCLQLTYTLWRLLHLRSGLLQSPQCSEMVKEHINLFWCIFVLETSVSMGASKRIPSSAVAEMPLPLEQPGNRARDHFFAAIRIAQIRHDVLLSRTSFLRVPTAQELAICHLEELQKLQLTLGIDVDPFAPCLIRDDFQLWTTLSFLTTRLMVNEAFSGSLYRDTALSTAQNALLILTSIGMDTVDNLGDQSLLPLLFATESLAAVSALASNVIQDPNATSDIESLKSFHQSLKKANMICSHTSFGTRLEGLMDAIMEFVAVVRVLPDSCPSTDVTAELSDMSVDFSFLDTDQLT